MLVSTTELNLGTIQLASSNKSTVTITAELFEITVNSVIAGCGSCTTAAVDKKTVQPAGVITLEIDFRPTTKGINRKRVTLNIMENATNSVVHIYINATVV